HHLLAAPWGNCVGRVAPGSLAGAATDQAKDATARRGGKDIAVLCDLARGRQRERSLLRRLSPQRAERDRDPAARRRRMGSQHRLGRLEIGRASCRERVLISGGQVSLKKK